MLPRTHTGTLCPTSSRKMPSSKSLPSWWPLPPKPPLNDRHGEELAVGGDHTGMLRFCFRDGFQIACHFLVEQQFFEQNFEENAGEMVALFS